MSVQIREAEIRDIPHLAYVWRQASGGVYDAVYEDAIPGREIHLLAEHAFTRTNSTTSFRHCWVLEADGEVVGGLHGYAAGAMADDPEDPLFRSDRVYVFQPFEELPHPAADSFFVNAVGFYPEKRGRGYGMQLMQEAENIARSRELTGMSLHVFEENSPGVSLYKKLGYDIAGRRPVVPHPLIQYEGHLLLMTKSLN